MVNVIGGYLRCSLVPDPASYVGYGTLSSIGETAGLCVAICTVCVGGRWNAVGNECPMGGPAAWHQSGGEVAGDSTAYLSLRDIEARLLGYCGISSVVHASDGGFMVDVHRPAYDF